MLKEYFKFSSRSLRKNKIYTVINILGLSAAICCSVLISLWIREELSWDDFHKNKDLIYQVWLNESFDKNIKTYPAMPYPLADELEKTIPEVQSAFVTDWGQEHLLTNGEKRLNEYGYYADNKFLETFSFPAASGLSENALADPKSIVLTQSMANALFKSENPINKTVKVDNLYDMKVTSVVKDPPHNSAFQFSYLLPANSYAALQNWIGGSLNTWGDNFLQVFVQLKPGSSLSSVNLKIANIINKHDPKSKTTVFLHPISKWHLYSDFKEGRNTGGLIEYVRIFAGVAIFILLIGCINFMNLATARAIKRAKEIGVRKALGSGRKQLIYQFLTESVLTSLISFVIALIAVTLLLPSFNNLVQENISIDYSNTGFWLFSFGFILIIGLLSGSYPAFYLSSFNPVKVLKGNSTGTGKATVIPRKILVTLQFAFSIFLIAGTIVIYLQLQHVKNRPIGFNKDNLISISPNDELTKNFHVLKNDLLKSAGIGSVTRSSSPVTNVDNYTSSMEWPGKRADQKVSVAFINTDYDYIKTIGATLILGRDFSDQFLTDSSSIIINEAAVRTMGLHSPIGSTAKWRNKTYRIIGVIKNVLMSSPYQPIEPTVLFFKPASAGIVSIRIKPTNNMANMLNEIKTSYNKYCKVYPAEFSFADREFETKFISIQLVGKLSNIFSSLAIIISCLGLLGLLTFAAEQRKKEIGVRKVLGASIFDILYTLLSDFAKLILVASFVAIPLASYFMQKWLQNYDYRINISLWVFLLASIAATIIALFTIVFQAVKAANANPVESLRAE